MQLFVVTDDNRRASVHCAADASLHDVLYTACGALAFLWGSPLQIERVKLAVTQQLTTSSLQHYSSLEVPDVTQLVFLPMEGKASAFLRDQCVVYLLGCKPTVADELVVQRTMAKHMASFSSMLADILSNGTCVCLCGFRLFVFTNSWVHLFIFDI